MKPGGNASSAMKNSIVKTSAQKNPSSSNQQTNDNKIVDIKSYHGPINLSATLTKNPVLVINEIQECLVKHQIFVKKLSSYKISCNKKVVIEINKVGKCDDLFVLRFYDDEEEKDDKLMAFVTDKIFEEVELE